MDTKKTWGTLATGYVPPEATRVVKKFLDSLGVAYTDVILAGGFLCEHATQDADLFVLTSVDSGDIIQAVAPLRTMGLLDYVKINRAYGEGRGSAEYSCIVQFGVKGFDIDVLFLADDILSVPWYLSSMFTAFPLSIQRSCCFYGLDLVFPHTTYMADPIIVYKPGKSENKYRRYYPDTEFIRRYTEDDDIKDN